MSEVQGSKQVLGELLGLKKQKQKQRNTIKMHEGASFFKELTLQLGC